MPAVNQNRNGHSNGDTPGVGCAPIYATTSVVDDTANPPTGVAYPIGHALPPGCIAIRREVAYFGVGALVGAALVFWLMTNSRRRD